MVLCCIGRNLAKFHYTLNLIFLRGLCKVEVSIFSISEEDLKDLEKENGWIGRRIETDQILPDTIRLFDH